jgi:hypothetical protein
MGWLNARLRNLTKVQDPGKTNRCVWNGMVLGPKLFPRLALIQVEGRPTPLKAH